MSADGKLTFFIFDCESIGLHGDTFAVAGGVWSNSGECLRTFYSGCSPDKAKGGLGSRMWVKNNIPKLPVTHALPLHVREFFWEEWLECKKNYPGIVMAVECGWPVESRFLAACVDQREDQREFEGPYPLHEIATVMTCAGMNPMASYARLQNELPAHDPRADAQLSGRLLFEALKIIER